ncbi:MAG: hypothetical protein GOU98_04185 [Candidatus Altiarchaeota archaeon]|nr:hypothetical protein [Candidatus Altiarchaeota archaeon]
MVFGQITSLALVDAINPCTLAIQALLLSSLVLTKKRREVFFAGLLFTFTILLMYALYGFGVLQVIYAFGIESQVRIILRALIVIMAIVEINAYFSYKPGFASMEMPMSLRPIFKKATQSIDSIWSVIPVAVLASIVLLPCSSGPYIAALAILVNYELVYRIPLLIYYNILFTAPMFIITFVTAFGTSPKRVMDLKNKYIKELHLIAGILLIAVLFMV